MQAQAGWATHGCSKRLAALSQAAGVLTHMPAVQPWLRRAPIAPAKHKTSPCHTQLPDQGCITCQQQRGQLGPVGQEPMWATIHWQHLAGCCTAASACPGPHMEYRMGRRVALRASDILVYRSRSPCSHQVLRRTPHTPPSLAWDVPAKREARACLLILSLQGSSYAQPIAGREESPCQSSQRNSCRT